METRSQVSTRLVLIAMTGAAVVSSLDLFVVNVAFDDIGHDLGVGTPGGPTPGDLSWVLSAYAVIYAALLVPFGRLADRYGRKQMFLGGVALFVAASVACALAAGVWWLVAFRGLQAVGAAAMTPTSLSILLATLPPERRLAGVRAWASAGAVAAAVGPSVGGVLSQASWHWVFLINVPIGVVLWWLAARHVREAASDDATPRPDLVGAALFAVAVGLLALGLVKSAEWGWDGGRTWASFVGSAVVTTALTLRSRGHVAPVIDPGLLRVRTFRRATLAMVLFNVAFGANLLIGVLWMQQVWGWSVLQAGLGLAVGPFAVPVTAALTQRFLPAMHPARLVAIGSVVCGLGIVVMALLMGTETSYLGAYVPGWVLGGIGVGFALPNLMGGSTHELPAEQSATGSGIVTMARQLGFVIGVSVLFAVVGDRQGVDAVDGFRTTWWVMAGVLVLAAVAALGMEQRERVAVPAVTS